MDDDGSHSGRDYLFDMLAELAKFARRSGELPVAILLEAILAAHGPHAQPPLRRR